MTFTLIFIRKRKFPNSNKGHFKYLKYMFQHKIIQKCLKYIKTLSAPEKKLKQTFMYILLYIYEHI